MHLANLSVIFIALVVAATALKIPRYFRGDFEKDIANIDLGLSFRQFLFYYFTNFCCSLPSRSVGGVTSMGLRARIPYTLARLVEARSRPRTIQVQVDFDVER